MKDALSAGITYVIMRKHARVHSVLASGVHSVPDGTATAVTVNPFMFFSKQANNISTIVHRNNQGPPSYMVECLEDNVTWLSQKVAAAAKGVDPGMMSSHINHGIPGSLNGEHFRRIGVAVA
jgi:hypothetical protein